MLPIFDANVLLFLQIKNVSLDFSKNITKFAVRKAMKPINPIKKRT